MGNSELFFFLFSFQSIGLSGQQERGGVFKLHIVFLFREENERGFQFSPFFPFFLLGSPKKTTMKKKLLFKKQLFFIFPSFIPRFKASR